MSGGSVERQATREAAVPRRKSSSLPEGISARHRKNCPRAGEAEWRCGCPPRYQAQVWSSLDRRRLSRTFSRLAAAKRWRRDAQLALDNGALTAGGGQTVRQAGEALIEGMRAGTVRTRSGRRYKPSAIRTYEDALRRNVYPALGPHALADLRRGHVQRLADRLLAQGLDPSTVRNQLMPLRVIYRRALALEDVQHNPTRDLQLPAVEGRRERIATADEAERLIQALPESDQALWAFGFYQGLRRGELAALRLEEIDLDQGVIRVRHGWDRLEGLIDLKSRAGRRDLPLCGLARRYLMAHVVRTGRRDGFVFGRSPETPFTLDVPGKRAAKHWGRAGLEQIGLHEARHTYASLMIAAMADAGRFNAKVLQELMGHASITETFDRYGHLFPGTKDEAAGLLDAYLDRAAQATLS
jgi:integrase